MGVWRSGGLEVWKSGGLEVRRSGGRVGMEAVEGSGGGTDLSTKGRDT